MKKLFALKEWLTLQDTARHLAIMFGEDVCEADVLRLALDGHLKLSVNFVNQAHALKGKVVPIEEAQYRDFTPEWVKYLTIPAEHLGKPVKVMEGINLDDKRVLNLFEEVVTLAGVYDLVMLGNERLDVEHQYQTLTGGPSVTLYVLAGAFVMSDASTMYQLLERYDYNEYEKGLNESLGQFKQEIALRELLPEKAKELLAEREEDRKIFLSKAKARRDSGRNSENYFPAAGLPDDCVIVIRTDALRELEQSINESLAPADKDVTSKERNSLLTIIAALCDYSAVDPKDRGTARKIASMTEELGAPVTDDTIRKVLQKIPDAVERRMK